VCETLKLCDSSGSGGSVDNFITDPPPRCRRDLRRLPQELRQDGQLCSLLILILLLSARQSRRHKSRLGCRLNAGVPTERRRSEGTLTKEAPNRELGHLVTWCLFKQLAEGETDLALARALSAAPLLRGVSRFPIAHETLWELCDSPGRARTMRVGQATQLQLTHRLVRIAARTVVASGVSHRKCVKTDSRVRC
jgi:hypothetical protein